MGFRFFAAYILFIGAFCGNLTLSATEKQEEKLLNALLEKVKVVKNQINDLQELSGKSKVALPIQVPDVSKRIEVDVLAFRNNEKLKNLSAEKMQEIVARYESSIQQMQKMRNIFNLICDFRTQYHLCLDSDFYRDYVKIYENLINAHAALIPEIIEGKAAPSNDRGLTNEIMLRRNMLAAAIKLLEADREVSLPLKQSSSIRQLAGLKYIPENAPVREEIKKFCKDYLEKVSDSVAELNSAKEQKTPIAFYEAGYSYIYDLVFMEAEIYRNETQFKELRNSEDCARYITKSQEAQEATRKIIVLSLKNKEGEPESSELKVLKKELAALKTELKALDHKLKVLLAMNQKLKRMDTIVKNCPEIGKTDYPARSTALIAGIEENNKLLSTAIAEKRRVLINEAECRKEMLNSELDFLLNEADLEAYFIKLNAKKDTLDAEEKKRLDFSTAQYKEAFRKLKEAKLETLDTRNRIRMLELKAEILEGEMDDLENKFEETKSASEEFFSGILNANPQKRSMAKDIDDAKKISNENPVGK